MSVDRFCRRHTWAWWLRWVLLYSHRTAWHRLVTCRTKHRGPMYDGAVCLTCGKDVFGYFDGSQS